VANQQVLGVKELFSVPVAGGEAVRLNGPLPEGGQVVAPFRAASFVFSGDSRRVVYVADEEVAGREELFSAPLAGGGSTKLNRPLAMGEGVVAPALVSEDSSRVFYRVRDRAGIPLSLLSTPIHEAEGELVEINSEPASGSVQNIYRATGRVLFLGSETPGALGSFSALRRRGASWCGSMANSLRAGRSIEPR
jgi:hypothetical protein